MISAALMLLAQPAIQTNARGPSIAIPPVIARQVTPYMGCMIQRANGDPRMPAEGAILRAIQADARSACAAIRRSGAEEADQILRRDPAHRDQARRQAFIDAAFDQVDHALEALASRLNNMNVNAPARPAGD